MRVRIKLLGWGILQHYVDERALCILDNGDTVLVPATDVTVMPWDVPKERCGAKLVGMDYGITSLCEYCAFSKYDVPSGKVHRDDLCDVFRSVDKCNTRGERLVYAPVTRCSMFKEDTDG